MTDRFKVLSWLSAIFFVLAWLTLVWCLFALFTARIDDVPGTYGVKEKGIGVMGAAAIVVDGTLRFFLFMGASQAIKLLLHLEQSVDGLARRLGDIIVATTDIKVGILSTNENVRKVGSIVYEEAKKDD